MAHRLLQDPETDGWERSDFPIVCETCLGPNPHVRMQRMEYGGTCHISGRPYTVFRWRPGNDARYKKTIICQEVAKAKNVCQVCLLDLDYNLPVQVRDQALGIQEDLPDSVAGREFALNQMQENGEFNRAKFGGAAANDILSRLNRTAPYYKRNQARVCSFFVRGECKRGTECPYRHEMPEESNQALSKQNIQDRYHGTNDPVAKKILEKVSKMKDTVKAPKDKSITTLFVGGVPDSISESDIRGAMYVYGELKSVKKIPTRKCAFVTFRDRKDAEETMVKLGNNLVLNGASMAILWGNPRKTKASEEVTEATQAGSLPNKTADLYPSMDPTRDGAAFQVQERKRRVEEVDDRYPSGMPPEAKWTVESLTPVSRREKVVFIGLDGAGKSFLIQNLKLLSKNQETSHEIGKMHPTLGLNVSQLASFSNISLLEIGGSPSIRPMWKHYYNEATKFVFIVDSSRIDRFDEAYREFSDFKEKTRSLELPTLLILNKMDLWHSDNVGKVSQDLGSFLKKCSKDDTGRLSCFSVSYLQPSSINKVLQWIQESQEDPDS